MRRRPLLTTILATTLAAAALAAAQEPTDSRPSPWWLAGGTVTCHAGAPSWVTGCFVERRLVTIGDLEVSLGLDAQADLNYLPGSFLAPYAALAVYASDWSAWAEVRLPELAGIPVLGSPDWLRVGFTYTVPP